ncbi:helix-turn-helix domain-containing protein [Frankia sp. AgPm24]|uniref:helix-turn-helix domain-containing protein n=1 Tax=Frankia sp. AgPm24 TaxID=631128 RepID=UPI00200F7906|nr:helix-turn-helix transcriptional regulator [Frankia sp. AgPm24]MCK9924589.1 helix-turn-helix domain-containing protein [Frankia sp. AgPm24]
MAAGRPAEEACVLVSALNVRELGDFIRDQRRTAQISLRQLAKQAGVSNPYLSQIERGLRRPSAEILQQIAKALRISAEALYVQAGILEERHGGDSVMAAVLADESLSERQKQVVLDIYEAFCKENAVANHTAAAEKQTTAAGTAPAGSEANRRPAATADQTGAGRPVATGTPVKVRSTTPRAPRRTATTGTATTGTATTGTAATASAAGTSVTTPRSTRTSRSARAVRASGTASKPAAAPRADTAPRTSTAPKPDAAPRTSTAPNVDPAATPGGTEQPEG